MSAENYCEAWASIGVFGGGLGLDRGMAEYMLVPSARFLVPIGSLSPATAALTDAALTPYHAIKRALPPLTPGAPAVVVGIGGLGTWRYSYFAQWLPCASSLRISIP
jgi:propanol-preferring alcohol dehydrogenase